MPISTTTNIALDVSFSQIDTDSLRTISSVGSLNIDNTLNSGNPYPINSVFFESGTLASGTTKNFNLGTLSKQMYGSSLSTPITGVIRGFFVANISPTGTGRTLTVRATGTNPCTRILYNNSGNYILSPQGMFTYVNLTGIGVPTGQRNFQLVHTAGSGCQYEMYICGTSG